MNTIEIWYCTLGIQIKKYFHSNNMHHATINWYIPVFLFNGEGKNGDNETSKLVYFILIAFIEVSVILLCGYSGNCVEIMIFGVSDFQRNIDWWNPFPSSSLELSSPPVWLSALHTRPLFIDIIPTPWKLV